MLRGGEALERCILEWADRKRGHPENTDLLSIIVNGPDEDGIPPSDATIVGHVTQLFSAAFETCQNVLVSTLMLLAQHPRIARDLLDELRGKLTGAAPTLDNVGNLPMLEAVIKETLRILPPVPLSMRVATQDTTLAGYAVPTGGRVVLNPFLTNRLPDLYADADSFQPGRWANTKPTAFEFLAFGAGPRACPGFGFAMNVLKVALASIMTRYRVSLVPEAHVNYWVRPLLTPSTDVRAVLSRQDGAFAAVPINGNIRSLVRFSQ
jgi:cytochrome P450